MPHADEVRVEYDSQIFDRQRRGGISRYFIELIRSLRATQRDVEPWISAGWSTSEMLVEAGFARRLPVARGLTVSRWLDRVMPSSSWRAELYHPTYYDPSFLRRRGGRPMAVTVVDMIPELAPALFGGRNPHLDKARYVREASLVLAISNTAASDLQQVYGAVSAPVVVTPLGVSSAFRPTQRPTSERPYLLYAGNRGSYKDYGVLAEALAVVRRANPEVRLIVVGGGPWSSEEDALHRRLGVAHAVRHRDATDDELAALMSGSLAFVFPSRLEGFGLPTIEAMACGAPVVLAEASVHPEVGGDAALYFAPGDPSSLAAQLDRLIHDQDLRNRHGRLGLDRAREFTWSRTASLTAAAYRSVLGA